MTLTSEFFSRRAFDADVEECSTNECVQCGLQFQSLGFSDTDVARYYEGYLDERYFEQRNRSEFFFTRRKFEALHEERNSDARLAALYSYLSSFMNWGENGRSLAILDYGGGSGHLISELPGKRFVFDLSGDVPDPKVLAISESQLVEKSFDLVVCAQVLEHVTDPVELYRRLYSLVAPGGMLYVEVPFNETWRDWAGDNKLRDRVLSFARRHRTFMIGLDVYGTAFRLGCRVLPPLGFVPVREHLNFFSLSSLEHLVLKTDAVVVNVSRRRPLGSLLLVRRPLGTE